MTEFRNGFLSSDALVLHNFQLDKYDLDHAINALSNSLKELINSMPLHYKEKIFDLVLVEIWAWRIMKSRSNMTFDKVEEWATMREKEKHFFYFLSDYKRDSENIFRQWFGKEGYPNLACAIANLIIKNGFHNSPAISSQKIDAISEAMELHADCKTHFEKLLSSENRIV